MSGLGLEVTGQMQKNLVLPLQIITTLESRMEMNMVQVLAKDKGIMMGIKMEALKL